MPSSAERVSMNAASSFGNDGEVSQFIHEQYGMLCIGRYIYMNLRMLDKELPTANHLFPQYEFQNAFIDGRMSAVYAGGKHKEYAKLFLKFLASREYSDLLVDSADGLPPNRRMVESNPDYFHPPKYPLEGEPNTNEFNWACSVALKNPYSCYNKFSTRIYEMLDQVMNNLSTAEESVKDTHNRINRYIAETVGGNPKLKEQYDKDVALQKKIDAYKAEGKKIPANWIKNPYYLQYYKSKNMLAAPERNEP
jgi:multiple sugar transport system substrate-binding protein